MSNIIQLNVEKDKNTLVLSFRQLTLTPQANYESVDKTFVLPNEQGRLKKYVDEVYSKNQPINAPNKADFTKEIINYILKVNVDSVDIELLNDFLDEKLEADVSNPEFLGNLAEDLKNNFNPLKEYEDKIKEIEKKNKELYNAITADTYGAASLDLANTNIEDEDFDFEDDTEDDFDDEGFVRSELDSDLQQGSNFNAQQNLPLPTVGGKKPVVNRQGMSPSKANAANLPESISIGLKGVAGDRNIEPVPKPIYYAGDSWLESENNSGIICSRDENYRQRPQTGAGAVYIYAGRKGSEGLEEKNPSIVAAEGQSSDANRKKVTGEANSLVRDSAYIYIAQKSDVDSTLRVAAKGTYGKKFVKLSDKRDPKQETRQGLSLVAMKADDIVLMSRVSGIRLITAPDKKSSKAVPGQEGGDVISKFGIDLIAGNDDSDLQPLVKGENLKLYLQNLSNVVDSIRAVLIDFITSQSKFNASVMKHTHYDPYLITMGFLSTQGANPLAFNEGKNFPSIEVVQAGTQTLLDSARQQANILSIMQNRMGNDMNAFNPIGSYKILSEKNRTN